MHTKFSNLLILFLLALVTSGCLNELQQNEVAIAEPDPGPVVNALVIATSPALPSAMQFENYSADLSANGGVPAYSWSVQAGSLPAGIDLNTSTGEISGIALNAGDFNSTIQVTDSENRTSSRSFTLVVVDVVEDLEITTPSTLPATSRSANYSETLSVTGGLAPYSWSIQSGSLPSGLLLTPTTGEISGAATVAGNFNVTIQVTDSQNTSTSQAFTLEVVDVVDPLEITTSSTLPPATQSSNYSVSLVASGGVGPYTWAIQAGSLPAGLSLGSSSGRITGTASITGDFDVTIQVTDSQNSSTAKPFSLQVNAVPPPPANGLLDSYSASTALLSLSFISNDLSGITYVADTNTYFMIQNSGGRIWEVDSAFNRIRTISMSGFGDSEDIVYMGSNEFAIVNESSRIYIGTIGAATTSIDSDDFQRVTFDTTSGNNGYEGVAFDPASNTFWAVKEFGPRKIVKFQRPAGSANVTIDPEVPFDAQDLPASDLSAVHFDSRTGNLLILSDESHKVMEVAEDGTVLSELDMADSSQHEGLTLDSSFNIIATSEPNRYRIYSQ